jgi:hypothetical protein
MDMPDSLNIFLMAPTKGLRLFNWKQTLKWISGSYTQQRDKRIRHGVN